MCVLCVVKGPDAAEISEGVARDDRRPAPEHNNPSTITIITTVPP